MDSIKKSCGNRWVWLLFIALDAICLLILAYRYFINTSSLHILGDGVAWTCMISIVMLVCVLAFCRGRKRWIISSVLLLLLVGVALVFMYAESWATMLEVPMTSYAYYPGTEVNSMLIWISFCVHSILATVLAMGGNKANSHTTCALSATGKQLPIVARSWTRIVWIALVVLDALNIILLLQFWLTGSHNALNPTLYAAVQLSGFYVPICFAIAVLWLYKDAMRFKALIPLVIIIFDTLGVLLWSNNTELLYGYSLNPYPGPHVFTLVVLWNFYLLTCTAFALILHEYKCVRLGEVENGDLNIRKNS